MLGHLIRKEILDHISSLRFLILAALGSLTIWLSLFSGYTHYQARLEDYRSAQATTEERIRQIMTADEIELSESWMEISSVSYQVHRAPTPVCIFVRGLAPSLGRSIPVQGRPGSRRLKLSPAAAEPILGFFPALDLGLVVQVVLGLFALLLTYDAVCGEKEAGTLRLTASFPVPRDRLLLGKLFGALIPTLAAFGLSLLLGTAVVLLMPEVQFTDPELARLGMVLGLFGLYLTVLICAGLFASSLTHRPATSFVILLAFWVGTVVVVPRISLIVADGIRPAPSVHEHQAERARIGREGDEARRGAVQAMDGQKSGVVGKAGRARGVRPRVQQCPVGGRRGPQATVCPPRRGLSQPVQIPSGPGRGPGPVLPLLCRAKRGDPAVRDRSGAAVAV